MRLLICGDRHWKDYDYIYKILQEYSPMTTVVITGGATGADSIANQIATELKMTTEVYPADWKRYGKSAGPIRNAEMIKKGCPDVVLAFHNNLQLSKGTANMITKAREVNIPVYIFP